MHMYTNVPHAYLSNRKLITLIPDAVGFGWCAPCFCPGESKDARERVSEVTLVSGKLHLK